MRTEQLPILMHNQVPASSLDSYIQYANSIPVLSKEEEADLFREWHESNGLQAAQRLVLSHLRYVVRIARGYMGYGLNLADLIQEGTIGLMKAVKKFKPEREVRLVTFAMHWIKAEIHEFIIRNWRIVKIATTKPQRKLFFKLRSRKKGVSWLSAQEVRDIALDLGVQEKEVVQMEARMSYGDTPFDLPENADESDERIGFAPVEYLEHKSDNPEQVLEQESWSNSVQYGFDAAFARLDDRAKHILSQRWLNEGEKATLEDLSQHFNISKERVRQLEVRAIKQLREWMVESSDVAVVAE